MPTPYIQLPSSATDEKPRRQLVTPARAGIVLIITLLAALFVFSPASDKPMSGPGRSIANPAGWYSRATPHPDGSNYDVKKENVVLGLLRNSRVEPEGFSVALFKPNVAVDAMGRVWTLNDVDFDALTKLATLTRELPDTGAFRNQWRVKHDRTDYPIDQLYVSTSAGLHTIGVYGHDGETTTLKPPVGDITELPTTLNSLVTLAKEGREGFQRGQENSEVTNKVKACFADE
ncbi:hypothetical protein RhiXN_09273 [Rhizoctonia solani]|uniref:Uncharacterized protein n=1 Tax=Rhizoctonia solani TaxID=456999 RepID=A0A8H8NWS5_9AGAM|nr:uncharacterized protein RhiXN_09273 [Rhizoctonia solani]QRW20298.1 hypothetical protein RhiXN_09273 [Rhizoctonia solani]